jgi:hypothetical protein
VNAPAIPPRIAARARETCEAAQLQVENERPEGMRDIAYHGDFQSCCSCDLIAAALLAQMEADCAAVLAKKGVGFPFNLALVAVEAIRAAAETPHGVAPTGKSVAPDGEKP